MLGSPKKGATDAWHAVLTQIENYKLNDVQYCGGVADIMKFFDQIRRQVVYAILRFAGCPSKVLIPYMAMLDELTLYNSIAGGLGQPHVRACGIPQGCPMSMMSTAILMRPWIMMMINCGVMCCVLADDVLIFSSGTDMLHTFTNALNATHSYLQEMGSRIAPSKSFNFASNDTSAKWLQLTRWPIIDEGIKVVNNFRYLGAHLNARASLRSPTLTKRIDKALLQLRRLQYVPATAEAKARAIVAKIYAGALYGVEAAAISTHELNKLTACVIDVFRRKTMPTMLTVFSPRMWTATSSWTPTHTCS